MRITMDDLRMKASYQFRVKKGKKVKFIEASASAAAAE